MKFAESIEATAATLRNGANKAARVEDRPVAVADDRLTG
jgi:hypothetical protein